MPDCGIRGGHRVEAVDLLHVVVERAAHDQPHDHLDAFGARLAHIFDVRDASELLRVLAEIIEKGLVPLPVDQAGARAADLVRHTACSEDDDVQILGIGFHRLANRLAEHKAAVPRRRWVHDNVDGQRDDRAGPLVLRLTEQKVHRHRQAMIDLHLVDDGKIELIENDGLRDMRRERGMTFHDRHGAGSPALIGGGKFRRAAEREGRDHIDGEGGGMVVIDHDGNVRLGLRHPVLGLLEAGEYPLPVGLLGPACYRAPPRWRERATSLRLR